MDLKDKNLYYVGGVVRDELLGIESVDTDYCYEGNAIDFVKEKGFKILKTNEKLGTARILIENKEIDVASTRCENYPRKGHLPVLKKIGCELKEDLIRRDFTVNAMAKRTTDGEIIDLYGGLEDLKEGKLRVLHENSFKDDPTRIIRGLKFAARFGFKPEEKTKKLQDEYLENVNYDMSYHRLKKELVSAFSLNKKEVFEIFNSQKMYKLLGENQSAQAVNSEMIENLITEYPSKYSWIIYLSFYDLSKLPLLRAENKILEWAERLKTQKPTNNTPLESILIHKIRATGGADV